MNNVVSGVLLGLLGTGLFAGSVVGLLAISGRLNSEGVKKVPVLDRFFTDDVSTRNASAGKGSQEGGGEQKDEQATGGKQGGSFKHADRISRRKLFTLEGIVPETTRQEIQDLYSSIKEAKVRFQLRKAALEKREYELRLREDDLEQRRKSVEELMNAVTRAKEELLALRRQFDIDITTLATEEIKNIKRQAATLAAMEAKKASDYLIELTPEKEALAVKILVAMEPEAAAQVLDEMDVKRGARLIEKATRVLKRE